MPLLSKKTSALFEILKYKQKRNNLCAIISKFAIKKIVFANIKFALRSTKRILTFRIV